MIKIISIKSMLKFFFRKKTTLLVILTILASCIVRQDKKGYNFDISDADLLQIGITTKDGALRNMGSPTIIFDFDDHESWIYYSQNVKNMLFFKPKVFERKILVVKFDEQNTINSMENYDLSNQNNIKFTKNVTPLIDKEGKGFFKEIFGNIGKVRPQ